jgi:hypothetical protein
MMRHFRECILGKSKPLIGAKEGAQLRQIIDAIYKSGETGKSVDDSMRWSARRNNVTPISGSRCRLRIYKIPFRHIRWIGVLYPPR